MSEVQVISNLSEFKKAVGCEGNNPETVAIIDFWATWCGPCRVISPVFKGLANGENTSKVKFYEVDVDKAADVAAECSISAMPTFIAFKNGVAVKTIRGANPSQLTALVKDLVEGTV